MYIENWGEETDFDMILDDGRDIDMTKICGCADAITLETCENNCPSYSSCCNIAFANDLLVAYYRQQGFAA